MRVLAMEHNSPVSLYGSARVYDWQTLTCLHTLKHTGFIEGVAYNPQDDTQFVTVGHGGQVRL
eukprot:EC724124.1.p4 GENE.EC724124.1~~EC724124.1.p4  ORF type:complete len:63 (+),score=3.64 EC724124.1:401-589(+)